MKISKIIYSSLVAACLTGCIKDNRIEVEEYIGIGDPVPVFSVMNYNSAQTAGKTTLITFFDPACNDCRRELPLLLNVWENLKNATDFEMVNLSRDRTLENLALADGGTSWLSMPCYPDPDRKIYNLFATSTIPRIYLVDREGIVRQMWVENTHLTEDEFLSAVRSYVETP